MGYATESVVIQITSGTIQNSITSGSNVTVNFENGSLTFGNLLTSIVILYLKMPHPQPLQAATYTG